MSIDINYVLPFVIVIIYYVIMVLYKAPEAEVLVTTTGPLRGQLIHDEDFDIRYYAYRGIPYAEPPVGSMRFKPPVAKTPWIQTLDATTEGPVCSQPAYLYKKDMQNEDCLHLNIYVPENRTESLPVLVNIFGGAFIYSSGSENLYGPQLLVQNKIIHVNINARLGALGFLSLDTKDASGNAGLKDILMALKWIQDNIEKFGGDKNRVTVCGNSSGAGSIDYLLMSNESVGLFHRAMTFSGSALSYKMYSKYPKINAIALAELLGCKDNDTEAVLNCLKEVDATKIVKAHQDLERNDTRRAMRLSNRFVPSTEIESDNALITEKPMDITKSGITMKVPVLAGFTAFEGLIIIRFCYNKTQLFKNLNDDKELCIPTDIEYPYGSAESVSLAKSIMQVYFKDTKISQKSMKSLMDLAGDTVYVYPMYRWMKMRKGKQHINKLYHFLLEFDGALNWFKLVNYTDFPDYAKASHSDIDAYIFVSDYKRHLHKNLDPRTKKTLDTVLNLFANFIKFGNPTPDGIENGVSETKWLDYDEENSYLSIGDTIEMRTEYDEDLTRKLHFWDKVYEEYDDYVKKGGQLEAKVVP